MHRIFLSITTVFFLVLTPATSWAQEVISREAELKGKMLSLLVRANYVTWPAARAPTPVNPLTIGIVGDDPFQDENGVAHLSVPGARILKFDTAEDVADCHILVISKTADFKKSIEKTKDKPILVVSESPGLARQGAVMNLVYDVNANKIRLEINPTTARRLNLDVKRNLLRSPAVDIVGG